MTKEGQYHNKSLAFFRLLLNWFGIFLDSFQYCLAFHWIFIWQPWGRLSNLWVDCFTLGICV